MSFSSSMGSGIAWRKCSCRVAQSSQRGVVAQAELRNPTGCATARRLRKPQAELRNPGICASGVAQSWNLRNPSLRNPEKLRNRTLFLDKGASLGKLSQTSQATRQCLHVMPSKAHQHIAHRPCCHTWLRAKRWPQQRGCHQAPRLPRKRNMDVAKCHTCHPKCHGGTGDQRRPSAPPDAAKCPK